MICDKVITFFIGTFDVQAKWPRTEKIVSPAKIDVNVSVNDMIRASRYISCRNGL